MTSNFQMSGGDILAHIRHQAAQPVQATPSTNLFHHDVAPTISKAEAIKIAVEAALADDAIASSILARIGWDTIDRLRPKPTPSPLWFSDLLAMEVTLFDNGTGKAKRVRKGKEFIRYGATVSAYHRGVKSVAAPSWKATAQLRDVARMESDIEKVEGATRKVNLPDAYCEWLREWVFPMARRDDLLVGWLCAQTNQVGRHYHDRQVLLVPKAVLETGIGMVSILSYAGGAGQVVNLSDFVTTQSDGSDLKKKAILTTRASIGGMSASRFAKWAVSKLEL